MAGGCSIKDNDSTNSGETFDGNHQEEWVSGGSHFGQWAPMHQQSLCILCSKNGIHHIRTAVYSPESNGIVEWFHGSLKQMLAKYAEARGCWPDLLPITLFFLRMTPCVSIRLAGPEIQGGRPGVVQNAGIDRGFTTFLVRTI